MNRAERNLKLMEEGFLPHPLEDGSIRWTRGEDTFIMQPKDAEPPAEAIERVRAADAASEAEKLAREALDGRTGPQ